MEDQLYLDSAKTYKFYVDGVISKETKNYEWTKTTFLFFDIRISRRASIIKKI
jgi:hypothetical protein